jgi:hypothetical protein
MAGHEPKHDQPTEGGEKVVDEALEHQAREEQPNVKQMPAGKFKPSRERQRTPDFPREEGDQVEPGNELPKSA